MDHGPDFKVLPVLDMQGFLNGDKKERSQFVSRLREVCHHIGFFYIKNHGVKMEMMEGILNLTQTFFNLPQAEKDALCISLSPHYRGYGKLGTEKTLGISDYKETYDLGLEQTARETKDCPYLLLQGPNQWPKSNLLPWKKIVLEYIAALRSAGKQLMSAIALTLELPENYFTNYFNSDSQDAYAILRLLRYPPGRTTNKNEEPELGVGPHTDLGCLVLLLQDEVGGLQVQNCNGKWIDAPPIKDTFVVNIGEMLQVWSNNYFLATPHRVINTSSKIRHSIPFFLEPHLSTVVSPLTFSLTNMHRPPLDPQTKIIYGEHMLNIYKRSFS